MAGGRDVAVDSARAAGPPPPPEAKPEIVLTDEDYKEIYSTSARQSTYAAAAVLGVGLLSPNPAFSSMLSTFALSGVIGYQVLAMRHGHFIVRASSRLTMGP